MRFNNNNNNDDNELARYVLAHYWYSVQLICSTVRKSSDAQRRERARAKYPPQVFALIEIAAPRRICATVRKSSDAQRRERARAKYPPPAAGEGTPPERPACGRRGHAVMRSVVSAPAQNTPRPQQARVRRPKDPPAAGEGTPPERPAVMH
jgi:hypothetical protein